MKFIIASHNPGKLKEFKEMLAPLGHEVVNVDAYGLDMDDVAENGETFADNAVLKARYAYDRLHEFVIADDSGLCIEALPDILGVHTARFMGSDTDQTLKNQAVLDALSAQGNRRASFHSVIALVGKDFVKTFSGEVLGTIAEDTQGAQGFGYDPIFIPDGYEMTYAQMGSDKHDISHRGLALKALLAYLKDWK